MEESLNVIKKIIRIFKDRNLDEIELEFSENERNIRINIKKDYILSSSEVAKDLHLSTKIEESIEENTDTYIEAETIKKAEEYQGIIIKAPISGNFYLSPFPGAEPFIQEGQEISKGQVICIIESMKVLNEIESPYSGIVKKILVENSKFVREGDPLVLISQSDS